VVVAVVVDDVGPTLRKRLDGVAHHIVDAADAPIGRAAADHASLVADADAIDRVVALAREQFDELQRLRATVARQAVVERAKGVLMARQRIGEEKALELLRRHARSSNRRLVDIATAVLETHALFGDPQGGGD
jgi:hypothetical protein